MADMNKRGGVDCDGEGGEGERGERGERGHRGHRGHDGRDGRDAAVVHDVTLTGDGSPGNPLAVNPAALAGQIAVVTDGVTIVGNGTTGSPLVAVGTSPPAMPLFATRGPAPLVPGAQQPAFPASGALIQTTVIYANAAGSDVTGDGKTTAGAYLHFARAILDVPNVIDAGYRYIIDITDLGPEVLAQDWAMPPIVALADIVFIADRSFLVATPLTIRAYPKLSPAAAPKQQISSTDGGVVSAVGPGLTLLTVAGAGWMPGALKGKQVIRSSGSFAAACSIFDNTAATLSLCNTPDAFNSVGGDGDSFAFAAGVVTLTDADAPFTAAMVGHTIDIAGSTSPGNDGSFVIASFISSTQITYANATGATEPFPGTWFVEGLGGLILASGETINIVEPSAILTAPPSGRGNAMLFSMTGNMNFQGISLACTVPSSGKGGPQVANVTLPFLELCVVDEIDFVGCGPVEAAMFSTTATGYVNAWSTELFPRRSYWSAVGAGYFAATGDPIIGVMNCVVSEFRQMVFDNCFTIGKAAGFVGSVPQVNLGFLNCWWKTPQGDAISVVSPTKLNVTNCQIDGSQAVNGYAGNAITTDGPQLAVLSGVTGSGNTGYGAVTNDGAHLSYDVTTTIGDVDSRAYTNGLAGSQATWAAAPANDPDPATFSRVFKA